MKKIYKKITLATLVTVFSSGVYAGGENLKDEVNRLYRLYQSNQLSEIEDPDFQYDCVRSDCGTLLDMIESLKGHSGSVASRCAIIRTVANKLQNPDLKKQIIIDCAKMLNEDLKKSGKPGPSWFYEYQNMPDVLGASEKSNKPAQAAKEEDIKITVTTSIFNSVKVDPKNELKLTIPSPKKLQSGQWLGFGFDFELPKYEFGDVKTEEQLQEKAAQYFKDFYARSIPNQIFHDFSDINLFEMSAFYTLLTSNLKNDREVFEELNDMKRRLFRADTVSQYLLQSLKNQAEEAVKKIKIPGLKTFFYEQFKALLQATPEQSNLELKRLESGEIFQALLSVASTREDAYKAAYFKTKSPLERAALEKARRICLEVNRLSSWAEEDVDIICKMNPGEKEWKALLNRLQSLSALEERLPGVGHPDFEKFLLRRIDHLRKKYSYHFEEVDEYVGNKLHIKPKHAFYSTWLAGTDNHKMQNDFSDLSLSASQVDPLKERKIITLEKSQKQDVSLDLKRKTGLVLDLGEEDDSHLRKKNCTDKQMEDFLFLGDVMPQSGDTDEEAFFSKQGDEHSLIFSDPFGQYKGSEKLKQQEDYSFKLSNPFGQYKGSDKKLSQKYEIDEMDIRTECTILNQMRRFLVGQAFPEDAITEAEVFTVVPSALQHIVKHDMQLIKNVNISSESAMQTMLNNCKFPGAKNAFSQTVQEIQVGLAEKKKFEARVAKNVQVSNYQKIQKDESGLDEALDLLFPGQTDQGEQDPENWSSHLSDFGAEEEYNDSDEENIAPGNQSYVSQIVQLAIRKLKSREEIEESPQYIALLGELTAEEFDGFFNDFPILKDLTELLDETTMFFLNACNPRLDVKKEAQELQAKSLALQERGKTLRLTQVQAYFEKNLDETLKSLKQTCPSL